jgi:hypothetical protein
MSAERPVHVRVMVWGSGAVAERGCAGLYDGTIV